jgi:tetratricopeptide (TPR) repeat protein
MSLVNERLIKASQLHTAGNLAEARILYESVLKEDAINVDALHLSGVLEYQEKKYDKAIALIEHALKINPLLTAAYSNLANVYEALQQFDKAIDCYDKALTTDPRYAVGFNKRGKLLAQIDKLDGALSDFNQAITINPRYALAYYNRGRLYMQLDKYAEAIIDFKMCLSLDPKLSQAIWNIEFCNLLMGDYQAGYKLYEYRHSEEESAQIEEYMRHPVYSYGHLFSYKNIFVRQEQGIGDEIQLASMFDDVIKKFGNVAIEADERLIPIFTRSFPQAKMIFKNSAAASQLEKDNSFIQVGFSGLGKYLRANIHDFPTIQPYIKPDNHHSNLFQTEFKQGTNDIVVGLSWKTIFGTNPLQPSTLPKSLPLEELATCLGQTQGIRFVCLQYLATDADIKMFEKYAKKPLHIPKNLDLYYDLEGLVAATHACDFIITSSNVTAHIAGGLGKKCYVLLPKRGTGLVWFWGGKHSTTPWYPSLHLLRQTHKNNWNTPLNALHSLIKTP